MKTAVHQNSIECYHSLNLSKRQAEVMCALVVLVEATDKQIADHLGYTVNRVTGRITELRDKKAIVGDKDVMGEFGKKVRVNRIKLEGTLF